MGISKNHIHSAQENEYATYAKIMAHPARIAILSFVAASPGCLCKDIAERIKLSQPTTSQHLQVIQRMKVLNTTYVGGLKLYSLNKSAFLTISEGLEEYFGAIKKGISKRSRRRRHI